MKTYKILFEETTYLDVRRLGNDQPIKTEYKRNTMCLVEAENPIEAVKIYESNFREKGKDLKYTPQCHLLDISIIN